jgi:hypothetical protein
MSMSGAAAMQRYGAGRELVWVAKEHDDALLAQVFEHPVSRS